MVLPASSMSEARRSSAAMATVTPSARRSATVAYISASVLPRLLVVLGRLGQIGGGDRARGPRDGQLDVVGRVLARVRRLLLLGLRRLRLVLGADVEGERRVRVGRLLVDGTQGVRDRLGDAVPAPP